MADESSAFVAYKKHCEEQLKVDTTSLQVATLPYPYGRGIVTTKAIRKGACILRVPKLALLTHRASTEPEVKEVFQALLPQLQECAGEMEDVVLALLLLLHRDVLKGASKWHEHIALLPNTYNLPWEWSDEERDALHGAGLHAIAVAMYAQQKADYILLAPAVRAATKGALDMSVADWQWALGTVWSRGVSLRLEASRRSQSGEPELLKVIAPFFDMTNHSPNVSMRHFYDPEKGLCVVADQSVAPGEQVYLNYGPYTSLESIKLRGFLTPMQKIEWYTVQMELSAEAKEFSKRLDLVALKPPSSNYKEPEEHGVAQLMKNAEGVPVGIRADFNLHPACVNEALYRFLRLTLADAGQELSDLIAVANKDANSIAGLELESKVISALGGAYQSLLENLRADEGEAALLKDLEADWETGQRAMAGLTAELQKQYKYTAPPAVSTAPAQQAEGEEDDGLSIAKKVKPAKGKDKAAAPAAPATSNEADQAASDTPFTFSAAAHDVHVRRLQMVAYLRRVERGILEWHCRALEQHSNTLREISEEHNRAVSSMSQGGAAVTKMD